MYYNTNLDLVTFGAITEDIASKFFDENGMYAPHLGIANAMCAFYNYCVDKETVPSDFPKEVCSLIEIYEIARDEEFIAAFNSAIIKYQVAIDFSNAYNLALDIVNTKKSSIGYAVDIINSGVGIIVEKINSGLNEETLGLFKKIVKNIGDGSNFAEALAEEYGKLSVVEKGN